MSGPFQLHALVQRFQSHGLLSGGQVYYWNFIILLMEKYLIQATFELAKDVVTEIELYYDTFLGTKASLLMLIVLSKALRKCFR